MKKTHKVKYKQCRMRSGAAENVAWIPSSLATQDRVINIDGRTWVVSVVYDFEITEEQRRNISDRSRQDWPSLVNA